MTALNVSAIVDGTARVIADAVHGRIFAAGTTAAVTSAQPLVVPLDENLLEAGLPAVTVAMGPWDPRLQPGNERLHIDLLCAVWRERGDLSNVAVLYADRDAIADAFIAHTKAYLTETRLQSAVVMGGPGIVPRELGDPTARQMYLTLPFTVQVVCNRGVIPLAA